MRKIDDVHINFSHLQKFIPYEFILHNWKKAPRYRNFFYLIDASFTAKSDRIFKLCLPADKVERALLPIHPRILENADNLKVKLTKRDYGNIDLEVIKD